MATWQQKKRFLLGPARQHSNTLTPEIVLNAAKPASSPIHDEIEWNLRKAARLAQLEQARSLMRRVIVYIDDPQHPNKRIPTRMLHYVARRYRPLDNVIASPTFTSELLGRLAGELNALQERYDVLLRLHKKWPKVRSHIQKAMKMAASTQTSKNNSRKAKPRLKTAA